MKLRIEDATYNLLGELISQTPPKEMPLEQFISSLAEKSSEGKKDLAIFADLLSKLRSGNRLMEIQPDAKTKADFITNIDTIGAIEKGAYSKYLEIITPGMIDGYVTQDPAAMAEVYHSLEINQLKTNMHKLAKAWKMHKEIATSVLDLSTPEAPGLHPVTFAKTLETHISVKKMMRKDCKDLEALRDGLNKLSGGSPPSTLTGSEQKALTDYKALAATLYQESREASDGERLTRPQQAEARQVEQINDMIDKAMERLEGLCRSIGIEPLGPGARR